MVLIISSSRAKPVFQYLLQYDNDGDGSLPPPTYNCHRRNPKPVKVVSGKGNLRLWFRRRTLDDLRIK